MMKNEIWLLISLLGLLIFNWPFLAIFKKDVASYLFIGWGIFIILAAIVSLRDKDAEGGKGD